MTMFKKNGGFTLVELIVVIAILAILAGVAIPAYSGYITKAQDAAVVTELDAIATSAQAANSQAGEISKIVVASAKSVVVTATELSDDFAADFKLFYDEGATVAVDGATATITLSKEITNWANSSYAKDPDGDGAKTAGATWVKATGWDNGVTN